MEIEFYEQFMTEEPFVPKVKKAGEITADDVRREASRRLQVLVGARSQHHLDIIISNANREAIRLLRKGADNWTSQEAQRAAELEVADLAIEAIRAASNALEVMAEIPSDFRHDRWWGPR